jgi:hypothetical protein
MFELQSNQSARSPLKVIIELLVFGASSKVTSIKVMKCDATFLKYSTPELRDKSRKTQKDADSRKIDDELDHCRED